MGEFKRSLMPGFGVCEIVWVEWIPFTELGRARFGANWRELSNFNSKNYIVELFWEVREGLLTNHLDTKQSSLISVDVVNITTKGNEEKWRVYLAYTSWELPDSNTNRNWSKPREGWLFTDLLPLASSKALLVDKAFSHINQQTRWFPHAGDHRLIQSGQSPN